VGLFGPCIYFLDENGFRINEQTVLSKRWGKSKELAVKNIQRQRAKMSIKDVQIMANKNGIIFKRT